MNISDLNAGDRILGQFLLADAKKGVKDNGANYWSLILQDNTGSLDAKKWDYLPNDEEVLVKGNVIQVDGEVLRYRNALQVKVRSVEAVDQDHVDWSRFIACAPMSLEIMKDKLNLCLDAIKDPDIATLAKAYINDFLEDFLSYPAAVRNHHDYMGGLLFHSLTMADLAVNVCRVYPVLNRDLVLAGVLIHDIGKTIELSGVRGTQFTLEGKLLGHISIGHAEFRRKAKELGYFAIDDIPEEERAAHADLAKKKEVAVLLEHIILSHHTKPEFGSPVMPATREALAVAMVDDLDAKMNILDKAYRPIDAGTSTARLFNMDDRYFYKPLYIQEGGDPGLSLQDLADDLK
ncbi:MAG: HD domain-containing protein [Bacilli bacterium]|nr:HD domain-containing protein [Bacilli bacterium]